MKFSKITGKKYFLSIVSFSETGTILFEISWNSSPEAMVVIYFIPNGEDLAKF